VKQASNLRIKASPRQFSDLLLTWYEGNRRDLPWRRDRDPYRVWISEIMLQQTRVAAVIEHYKRFLQRFPTVQKLASAREASVLAAWSGLGYYRRARMMHAASKQIVQKHDGVFPNRAESLQEIAGIGAYTAAAIASICFGEPVAVVDGNVERVLSRMVGKQLERKEVWQRAQSLIGTDRPGDFNQAMMELGATVCVPGQPKCMFCPVSEFCATRGALQSLEKPARQKKQEIRYSLFRNNGSVLLVRRSKDASLMPGMWELPEAEAPDTAVAFSLRHSITVTDYTVHVVEAIAPETTFIQHGRWLSPKQISRLPLTGLAKKILRKADML
jgi:A/G-specific adenine glycosylase